MFYQITTFAQSQLKVAEFAALHVNTNAAIGKLDVENLKMDAETVAAYAKLVEGIVDQNRGEVGSEFTAQMQAADNARDIVFRRVRHKLGLVEFAGDVEGLVACRDVCNILLNRYPAKIVSYAYQEETSLIEGFLKDARTMLKSDAQRTLSLSDDLSALEDANSLFMEAYASRANQRAAGETGLTQKVRTELTELFDRLMLGVQYHANDTSNAAVAKANQDFLALINQFIKDAKDRVNQRTGNGGGNTNGNGNANGNGEAGDGSDTNGGGNTNGNDSGDGGGTGSGSDDDNDSTPPISSDDEHYEY